MKIKTLGKLSDKSSYDDKIMIVEGNDTCVINIAYPYEVDLDRIQSEADLLRWVLHLCKKTWMRTEALSIFIQKVGEYKGLKIHG